MKKLKNKFITKSPQSRLYNIPIPIIGLTGGIATGKSTVAQVLKEKGHCIIDADALVKSIYSLDSSLQYIKEQFPEAIEANNIHFKKLREIIFSSPIHQETIEKFIYGQMPNAFLNAFSLFNKPTFVIYDVPLLFEKQLDLKVDLSVCVYAPKETQLLRLMSRDHIESDLAHNILNKQMDIEIKKKQSNFIIQNTGDKNELFNNVQHFLDTILD